MRAAIVIPVRSDERGLAVTLAALGREHPVIVVVDGSHAATETVARESGATVVVLPAPLGSYAARNAGIDQLPPDTEVVLFTDAGCIPQPGWVKAHVEALREVDLSGGAVTVTHGRRPTPAEWVDACRNLRQQSYVEQGGYAATCNLGARRELLLRVRFDASLQSGGDREFCHRAGRRGATLGYTPEAAIEHPARTTSQALLAKARRVGRGIASLPAESRPSPPRVQRPHRGLWRGARAAGLPAGPIWGLRVAWLDHRRARVLHDEAVRPQPVDGLHVVVLLASRWSSLETMNTRWRQVVQAWVEHPDVARVTLVDHPRFRPSARRLVRPATSWLPGVELWDLTVPTRMRPSALDRLAWLRAGQALRAALPTAERRLVVSTSSISTPLLPHLRDSRTTCSFDAVDVWRNLAVAGDLGARLADGYASLDAAQTLTAVSVPIADSLRRWTPAPVTVIPNGVELAAYAGSRPAPVGLPDGPFAVYVGSLSSRLDVALTAQVASLLAGELQVVLAGPADPDTEEQIEGSDLVWLGAVATDLVPGLLQRASVGLFPHRHTDLTEAADSMKLLEYAAAGLPVVSTDLPGLPPGVVAATGALDFAEAVRRQALRPRQQHPQPWVLERDWAVVAESLLNSLVAAPAATPEMNVVR
jgi:glycosyltransferase involved in cell wall biosynthesis